MKNALIVKTFVAFGAVMLMGAGCMGSTTGTPAAQDSAASVSTSTISVSSPKAGATVGDEFEITGQAPAGQDLYAAAMVNGELVSLTFTTPGPSGDFTLDAPTMDAVSDGAFTLELYNLDADYNWVNSLEVPLKLAR